MAVSTETGGAREKHFDLLKPWASPHSHSLRERLGDRYILYGEWLYAKHTVFYDALPHYFLEFDILDTQENVFLDTSCRTELLQGLPVVSVPVLHQGQFKSLKDLTALIGPSQYILACRGPLRALRGSPAA